MHKIKKITLGLLLLLGVAFTSFKYDDRYFEIARNLDIFATLFKELNALYVDEINPNKAMRVSINAMLEQLDPYTNYYPEDDIEDFRTMMTGKYNGIGATVESIDGKHIVTMVYEKSPADLAGIKMGDELEKINNINLSGKTGDELARLIKGQTGTLADLQIKRFGETKPLKISVKRDVVKIPNVPHFGMIDKEVGYIQLNEFTATAASEIKSAFNELKDEGMTKLVLDLRGNPGGLLNMAIDICNFFLPKGVLVVETKGKAAQWNKKYGTNNQPLDTQIPVVVLINSKSASASEIVSGTLQDYDRAVVVGQKSYGKGLVQTTRPLSYNTSFKVTTAKYYIPSGRCIQAIDYSHRNEDGSVGKLPDSLKSTFYTKNGRPVYDGGGVDPDLFVEPKKQSDFAKQLVKEGLLFDFATQYYYQHQKDVPGKDFELSDNDYASFKTFVVKSGFNYNSKAQTHLNELKILSLENPNLSELKTSLAQMESLMEKQKYSGLDVFSAEIKEKLALDILSRYHYDKVMKFVSFERDQDVQQALKVLKNETTYSDFLKKK